MTLQYSLFTPPSTVAAKVEDIPYVDPFLAAHGEVLRGAGNERLTFDEGTWDHDARGAVGVDVEVYTNFVVICFKRFKDGRKVAFELSRRTPELDKSFITSILNNNTIISFNGIPYDIPIIYLALSGLDTVSLKRISDNLINGSKSWEFIRVPRINHIDLMETNPAVKQGLKMIHGRLHGRFIVDLPYAPSSILTYEQMNITTLYCFNDIDATEGLYKALREPLELRVTLGRRYKDDYRSKSDSQVGEAIVKSSVEVALGRRIMPEEITETNFDYTPPSFVKFIDPKLADILSRLSEAKFWINGFGKVTPPDWLKNLQITINRMTYTMGIGGLHSTEAHRALKSDDNNFLLDVDVASQYPNIIMKLGLYPKAMGDKFLTIYGLLIKERLAAKAIGDKVRADGGRIALNGVFGKLGSSHSTLYSPRLLIAVTLSGQLAILMLIDRAEAAGIRVVSANTDGVVFYCPRVKKDELYGIIRDWESETGFSVEHTPYSALYNSSVNVYVAVKEDGKVKRKGYIADPWSDGDIRGQIMKNPQMTICSEAIVNYIIQGKPFSETISKSKDIRQFITLIKVTKGGTWRGHYLGRAVRYYWSTNGQSIFTDGNRRVPKTEGARPLPELICGVMPADLDIERYVLETERLASDLGIRI